MSRGEQIDVLVKVVEVLERLKIPYIVGGSHASSAYGLARFTRDIDLLADIKSGQVSEFTAAFQAEFYADEWEIERAIKTKQSFNIIHEASMVKIDFFAVKSPFHLRQLERGRLEILGDATGPKVYVATPEDIILAKLDWYKKGNCISEQQWRDIANVIRVQGGKLDLVYLRQWAGELSLSDLLEQALEESLSE